MALTERDKDILRLAAKGFSDYRIARKLKSYPRTVTRQRKKALQKLELARADLSFAAKLKDRTTF